MRRRRGRVIPRDRKEMLLDVDGRVVKLTNLQKIFWPADGITKGDLLQYYLDVSAVLLPHLVDRAMVMRRYPDGIDGPSFFMKNAPKTRPDWLRTCSILHEEN